MNVNVNATVDLDLVGLQRCELRRSIAEVNVNVKVNVSVHVQVHVNVKVS